MQPQDETDEIKEMRARLRQSEERIFQVEQAKGKSEEQSRAAEERCKTLADNAADIRKRHSAHEAVMRGPVAELEVRGKEEK